MPHRAESRGVYWMGRMAGGAGEIPIIIIIINFYSASSRYSVVPLYRSAYKLICQLLYRKAALLNPSVSVNRIVFTCFLKVSIFSSHRTYNGRAFHSMGPA